ncbi:MAG: hypothetical protein HY303_08315 [Candidatus Wallbacteria bacterium]|nr:hypothetical protein [Candidatus Wallbacteria bacterium]
MKLAQVLQPDRVWRLSLQTAAGPLALDVKLVAAKQRKTTEGRLRKQMTQKSHLPNARFFEVDDEAELLTFWQEGKGVTLELAAYVPYGAILGLEPLD